MGRPPRGGRARGLREQTPAEPHGNLVGVARVVFRLAARDRCHRPRVPEDTRAPCWRTQVREPVPGAETCDGHDHRGPLGPHGLEKRLRTGWHVPGQPDRALLVQATEVPAAGMEVATAGQWVLGGGASHEVASSFARDVSHAPQTTRVCGGGGLNKYQRRAADCLQLRLRLRFRPRLRRSVAMTADVKGWESLFSSRHQVVLPSLGRAGIGRVGARKRRRVSLRLSGGWGHLPCVRRGPASVEGRAALLASSRWRGLPHTGAAARPIPVEPMAPGWQAACAGVATARGTGTSCAMAPMQPTSARAMATLPWGTVCPRASHWRSRWQSRPWAFPLRAWMPLGGVARRRGTGRLPWAG